MKSFLSGETPLGELSIAEEFIFYDIPRLFSCVNRSGQIYLVLSAQETSEGLVWLIAPVSKERLDYIRSGGITLRDAFLGQEDGILWIANSPADPDQHSDFRQIPAGDVPMDFLPVSGERLDMEVETLPPSVDQSLAASARSAAREIVEVALSIPIIRRTAAPARLVGRVLERVQESIDSIAQVIDGNPTTRGQIAPELLEQTQLDVRGFAHGSFGIVLESVYQTGMFREALVQEAIGRFRALLSESDGDRFRDEIRELRPRFAGKFRALLEDLDRSSSGLSFAWYRSSGEIMPVVTLPHEQVIESLMIVSEVESEISERVTVYGDLIGLNIRTKTFELFDPQEKLRYAGRIMDTALEEAASAVINSRYVAEIVIITETSYATGEEREKHQLAKLVQDRRSTPRS